MTLLEMNGLIKTVLGRERADVKGCIGLLERFQLLNLTPMMLLKNPSCVETIKRCRKYVGNVTHWGYTEEEIEEFAEVAKNVRKISDDIYHQIKVSDSENKENVGERINNHSLSLETLQHPG